MCLYLRNNPRHTEAIILFVSLQYVEIYVPYIDHEKVKLIYFIINLVEIILQGYQELR